MEIFASLTASHPNKLQDSTATEEAQRGDKVDHESSSMSRSSGRSLTTTTGFMTAFFSYSKFRLHMNDLKTVTCQANEAWQCCSKPNLMSWIDFHSDFLRVLHCLVEALLKRLCEMRCLRNPRVLDNQCSNPSFHLALLEAETPLRREGGGSCRSLLRSPTGATMREAPDLDVGDGQG